VPRARINVGILCYKSPTWLSFVLDGLARAQNKHTEPVPFVLALDPYPAIDADRRVNHVVRSADPDEHYLRRVYRAWNRIIELETVNDELVVLVNTDMTFHHGWLDALYQLWVDCDGKVTATSLLVESGRIPSAFPDLVRDLGTTPQTFDRPAWHTYAETLVVAAELGQLDRLEGGLYMPVLLTRQMWRDAGGYPIGNVAGTPGDHIFFSYLASLGYPHFTATKSLVYHVQVGEMEIAVD